MIKKLALTLGVLVSLLLPGLVTSATVFAQTPPADRSANDPLTVVCEGAGSASTACLGRTTQDNNPVFGPSGVLTRVVQIIALVTGVTAVIMIMVGGFRYIISSGDPANVTSAKNTILYAIIGLVVATSAQVIVIFVLNKL